jgi:hypothetical protein
MSNKLTVVMLDWKRHDTVRRLVAGYLAHPRVGEVIVWDSGPSRRPIDGHPNLRHIHNPCPADAKWSPLGLYPRYAMAAVASNRAVAIVDDDIELPEHTLTSLHDDWLRDSAVIHGLIGRNPNAGGNYTPETHYGPVQVVLTRALVVDRYLCGLALAHGSRIIESLPGTPRGNGEDILLSHVAMAHSGRLNSAYQLPYKNHGYDDANAISVAVADHGSHRSQVVKWCREQILGGRLPKS